MKNLFLNKKFNCFCFWIFNINSVHILVFHFYKIYLDLDVHQKIPFLKAIQDYVLTYHISIKLIILIICAVVISVLCKGFSAHLNYIYNEGR